MATISTLLDIGLFQGRATIFHFVWHWFNGMAKISTLLDIGLMAWLQYPLY